MLHPRHRRGLVLAGPRPWGLGQAARWLSPLTGQPTFWITDADGLPDGAQPCPPARARSILGQEARGVVLDLHGGPDPDLLGAVPGAVVDSTQSWLEPLQQLAGLAGIVAAGLAGLAIAVIALVTVFATRAALAAHGSTVELLRLIGATEGFIARRFQFHNMKLGLLGAIAGTIPGAVIILLGIGAARLDSDGLLAGLSPPLSGWLTIALLPATRQKQGKCGDDG